jgi:hypothetical protein
MHPIINVEKEIDKVLSTLTGFDEKSKNWLNDLIVQLKSLEKDISGKLNCCSLIYLIKFSY